MTSNERKRDEAQPDGDPAGSARGAGETPAPVDRRGKLAEKTPAPIDRRGKLAEEPFEVQITRDKVFVRFRGRLVRTLTGVDAADVRIAAAAGDAAAVQLLVARKTGNFKRGNER